MSMYVGLKKINIYIYIYTDVYIYIVSLAQVCSSDIVPLSGIFFVQRPSSSLLAENKKIMSGSWAC